MKKLVSLVLCVLMLAAMVCTTAFADDKVVIGMSISQLANPYFVSVMNGVQARAEELGYEVIVVDAQYDVAKQVSDFENFGNHPLEKWFLKSRASVINTMQP